MANYRGDAVVLWNSLSTLPVAADLVDATDGVAVESTYGWDGSAWFPIDDVVAADVGVGTRRGFLGVVELAGLFERLALVATQAALTDGATVTATYTPLRETV